LRKHGLLHGVTGKENKNKFVVSADKKENVSVRKKKLQHGDVATGVGGGDVRKRPGGKGKVKNGQGKKEREAFGLG